MRDAVGLTTSNLVLPVPPTEKVAPNKANRLSQGPERMPLRIGKSSSPRGVGGQTPKKKPATRAGPDLLTVVRLGCEPAFLLSSPIQGARWSRAAPSLATSEIAASIFSTERRRSLHA